MGLTTIEWVARILADGTIIPGYTFNIVIGCSKVSPACANCYAERFSKRIGLKVWGQDAPRQTLSDAYWREPLKWNKEAEQTGERRRVFCGSLCDVMEENSTVTLERKKLWPLIEATPYLDWLLLTKRPENFLEFTPASWYRKGWPSNVWALTTVESQPYAGPRISALLSVPAVILGLSCEPLLGRLSLTDVSDWPDPASFWGKTILGEGGINVVIAGGESGHHARPSDPDHFRSLRDQCVSAGVNFFFKQWGAFTPDANKSNNTCYTANNEPLYRVKKKDAGHLLDGVEWRQMPESRAVIRNGRAVNFYEL